MMSWVDMVRLLREAGRRSSVSDADVTVAAAIRGRFERLPSTIEVDTAAPLPAVVDRVRHRVQPWRTTV
jgi:hypothetical protein